MTGDYLARNVMEESLALSAHGANGIAEQPSVVSRVVATNRQIKNQGDHCLVGFAGDFNGAHAG
ncbi:MAG: hypothetical protein JXD19_08175 [Deltaproteobacteria bacterium]|nr:hypothetical protein [Deltaproteobacteria bacterium]